MMVVCINPHSQRKRSTAILLSHNIFYLSIMDRSEQLAQHIDQQLLRSTKEHIDKQTDRLLSYFGEEFKFVDPLNLIGKRFKDKEAEFQAMRQNQNELMIKTRNLTEELQKLRGSLNKSRNENMHISLDRTERVQNEGGSQLGRTIASDNSQILQKMKNLDKHIELARQDYKSYAQEFDRLLQYLFCYVNREKSVQQLYSQTMSASEYRKENDGQEHILVPKKRYEKLIEIYSINMADISVNEYRKQTASINSSKIKQFENKAINYEQQSKRQYKQNYSDIAKDEKIDAKDLYLLFRALARKVGLQKQWERYHLNNTNQAVKFKSKIQSIFKKHIEIDGSAQKGQDYQLSDKQLFDNLNKVLLEIKLEEPQIKRWNILKAKIDEDRLIDIQRVGEEFEKMMKMNECQLIERVSLVINATITKSLQSFSKMIETRLRIKGVKLGERLEEIKVDTLKQAIEAKKKVTDKNIWQVFGQTTNEKIEQIFKKLSRNIVFLSSGVLYQSLASQP